MKLRTKFTLLVASCTFVLLGIYYLLSVYTASNAFVEFNQKSVVQMTTELLDDDDVEAQITSLPPNLSIQQQYTALSHVFTEQLFILVQNERVILPSESATDLRITYIAVEHGHQFKIAPLNQSPLLIQFSQEQLLLNDQMGEYALFWLPKNTLERKHQESLLMSRLADEFMLSLLGLSLLAALLSWLGAWYFLKPLKHLKHSFKDIENGNLDTRIEVIKHDEVGEILASFNRLAAWLQGLHQQYRQMNSDLSHELRTPLNAIRSRVEAMEDGILPMEPEQLSVLGKEVESLSQLIDDLSLLSLTESNQLTLQFEEVNITQLITDLMAKYQLQASSHGIVFTSDLAPNTKLVTDAKRLRQILVNLLDNAFKYGAAGRFIKVSLHACDTYVDVAVEDHGEGMSHTQLDNIFERFYRVQTSRNDTNSLGLGLPICKQLAELLSAALTVVSEPNKGAKFSLRLFKKS